MKNSKLMLILLLIWCTITYIVGIILLIIRNSIFQSISVHNHSNSSYASITIISLDIIPFIALGLIILANVMFLVSFKKSSQASSNDNSRYDEILKNVICRTDFSNDAGMQITITSAGEEKVNLKIDKK